MVSDGYSFTRGVYMLSDEKAIGLSNTTLWKKGRHYIFNDGPSKGWSVGFKTGSNYLSFFTSIFLNLWQFVSTYNVYFENNSYLIKVEVKSSL